MAERNRSEAAVFIIRWVASFLFLRLCVLVTPVYGADGCTTHPTVTVANSAALVAQLQVAQGCDLILLAPGTYADLEFSGYPNNVAFNFSNYVTIRSANPESPAVFEKIVIGHASFIRFDRIVVHHIKRPGEQDWSRAVDIEHSHHIEFVNSVLHGSIDGDYDNDVYGFYASDVQSLRFEGNTIHDFTRGTIIGPADHVVVRNNHYYHLRSDGADFAGVVDVLVEGNSFTDFHPCCGDHPDMIQFWNDNGTRVMRDVVIRNNLLLRGPGEATQSIFIQSNSSNYRNQNFLIEGNVIYNGHSHGISISETDGVTIQHNTVLAYRESSDELVASINTYGTTAAVVRGNVATAFSDSGQGTVMENNVLAQNGTTAPERALSTHFDTLFMNPNSGAQAVREDFLPRPGSILLRNPGLDVGALEYDSTPDTVTALILSSVSSGPAPLAVHFDGALSGGPSPISSYVWQFADGQSGSGATVDHTFQNPGTYLVTLSVTDGASSVDTVQKTIIVNPPPIVGLIYGLTCNENLLDYSGNEIPVSWIGTESYGAGMVEQALSLDGTSNGSYVYSPHREELDGMDRLSIAFWARKNSAGVGGHVVLKHITYWVEVTANGLHGYLFNQDSVGDPRHNFGGSSDDVQDTGWHHYAVTYDGTVIRSYIDGEQVGSAAMTGPLAIRQDRDLYVGKDPWGNSFNGSIDELKLFNIALSSEQIAALATPNVPPLVDAGPDIIMPLNGEGMLHGSFVDDELPLFGTQTISWSKVSGPQGVSFSDSSILEPSVTFTAPGSYVLRLAVHDGEAESHDDVSVQVFAPTATPTPTAQPTETPTPVASATPESPSPRSKRWKFTLSKKNSSRRFRITTTADGPLSVTVSGTFKKFRMSLLKVSRKGRRLGAMGTASGLAGSMNVAWVPKGTYAFVVRGSPRRTVRLAAQISYQ